MYNGGVGRLLRILLRSLVELVSYIRRIYVQSSSHVDACYKVFVTLCYLFVSLPMSRRPAGGISHTYMINQYTSVFIYPVEQSYFLVLIRSIYTELNPSTVIFPANLLKKVSATVPAASRARISSPPPILTPLTITLGTVRRPVTSPRWA